MKVYVVDQWPYNGGEKKLDDTSYFQNEMEKLERQQKNLHDQYNQEMSEFNVEEYVRKLRAASALKYAISPNEKLSDYMVRLRVHLDIAANKNIDTHVVNRNRGCWFTHKDKFGVGCFMCEDLQLIHYLMSLLEYLCKRYPTTKLDF